MALEAYSSQNTDKIHTDVLSQARISCYKARDAFYSCLEKESSKKPTEIATVGLLYPVECKKTREEYVKQCRPTWVKHFDRQYCGKKRVQRLLDDTESRRVGCTGIEGLTQVPPLPIVADWTVEADKVGEDGPPPPLMAEPPPSSSGLLLGFME
ncbi:uncharacterized protein LOC129870556 isoform X1 [Solanum dulcamara]|uniref:uncharacterized protein LOC129870556 isoform X1 n=1 Tax=Solanum dulcamara TaxID=45834 RepID=UPI002485FB6B|nr:uncharacterized protein LOC129870556 isoform X1 [Solanum dulcamara]